MAKIATEATASVPVKVDNLDEVNDWLKSLTAATNEAHRAINGVVALLDSAPIMRISFGDASVLAGDGTYSIGRKV